MTIRRRYQVASAAPWVVGAALLALAGAHAPRVPDLMVFAVVLAATAYVARGFARRLVVAQAWRRLRRDVRAERFERALALVEELSSLYRGSRRAAEVIRAQEGSIHSLAGDYARAAKLLGSVDLRLLADGNRALVLNNLAWSLALSGEPERAVGVARESMACLDAAGDRAVAAAGQEDLRGCQLGTLGAALVLSGDPAGGLPLLEQAFARGGSPRLLATRAYFQGEGLRAMGREEDARLAYERAQAASPDGAFGKKAAARLADGWSYRAPSSQG